MRDILTRIAETCDTRISSASLAIRSRIVSPYVLTVAKVANAKVLNVLIRDIMSRNGQSFDPLWMISGSLNRVPLTRMLRL